MTARDDVIAALDVALAQAAADQAATDQVTINQLNQEIATLEAELAAATSKVTYGSAVGGYIFAKTETSQQAYNRISAAWNLNVIRCFLNNNTIPSYYDPNAVLFMETQTPTQAIIETLAARNSISYLSVHHEPENDNITPAQWATQQMNAANLCAQYGNGRVRYVSVLMGSTFIPARNSSQYSADQWFNFDLTNVWAVGADCYQWGKNDTNADTASTVIQPVLDFARKIGKHVAFGELGVRRPVPPFASGTGISDTARAKYLTDLVALLDQNADIVDLGCYFESDNGATGRAPWNLLAPPGQITPYSPQAQAVWAAACNR